MEHNETQWIISNATRSQISEILIQRDGLFTKIAELQKRLAEAEAMRCHCFDAEVVADRENAVQDRIKSEHDRRVKAEKLLKDAREYLKASFSDGDTNVGWRIDAYFKQ